jgi:outer membrane protein OmpA-like peptidoglycan-associated protein
MKLKILLLFSFSLWFCHKAYPQATVYYVVIGGFAVQENAQKFAEYAMTLNVPATYSLNPERNLYYVYVRSTGNKGKAYTTLARMQEEGFNDAWVFKGWLGGPAGFSAHPENPITAPEIPVIETPKEPVEPIVTEKPVETVPEKPISNEPVVETPKPAGKPFLFKLVNEDSGNSLTVGQVHLLESDRANQYRGYNANEIVYVVPPNNRGGRWYVACQVIGFQPYHSSFSYKDIEKLQGVTIGENNEIVVPLAMRRVRKGDYIEMDQVKFIENSDIFMPTSERELGELVAMMEEGKGYKIRLHGHTNGDQAREVISMGTSENFFALDAANTRAEGSAKQLSTQRAETVKKYLVSKGIDADRISVRGEGGKQPIFDPKGTAAMNNARVEVEIVKH